MKSILSLAVVVCLFVVPSAAQAKRKKKAARRPAAVVKRVVEQPPPTTTAYAIAAGGWVQVPIWIDEPRIYSGKFFAQGGNQNDVQVYILDEEGLINFSNGNSARTYYNSGSKTIETFSVWLPSGRYRLVISNKSGWAARAVTLELFNP
jgi:hypothetical protein